MRRYWLIGFALLALLPVASLAQTPTTTPDARKQIVEDNDVRVGPQQKPIENPVGPSELRRGARDLQPGEVVNINTADADTLERLPFIGPSIARNIVDWREQNGPFATAEEIMKVPNIGPRRYEQIRAFLVTEAIQEQVRQRGEDRSTDLPVPKDLQ